MRNLKYCLRILTVCRPVSGVQYLQDLDEKFIFSRCQVTRTAKAEPWLMDLAGNKPLSLLAKRVPVFPKKEDIFKLIADHNVPMERAVWFIKMTNGYHSAIAESKPRSRRIGDAHLGNSLIPYCLLFAGLFSIFVAR